MWAPGIWELVIVLVIVMIVFGAGKLPQVGSSLGQAIKEFKTNIKPEEEDDSDSSDKKDDKE